MKTITVQWLAVLLIVLVGNRLSSAVLPEADLVKLVGQPADIASSAYQYRADRKADQNQPESWLALMRYANQPLNKPVDVNAPAIKQALCGLLWEEIRPVKTLELTWAADAKRRPAPEELAITTLNQPGHCQFVVEQSARRETGREANGVRRWNDVTSMIWGRTPAASSSALSATRTPRIMTCPRCGC